MSFSKGDLFHIEMRNGIYQVLDLYKSDDKGNTYIFRKVFDGKLNFKVSKADVVHDSWMTHISDKTYGKIADALKSSDVQVVLNDLTVDKAMQYQTNIKLEIIWCSFAPKSKKMLETLLNSQINGFVDILSLRDSIRELHDQGKLLIESCPESSSEETRLYRIELGRYFDDLDEFGNERFRCMRFKEVKIYDRSDLVE